uniref:ATP synthase complex subunit 8 n=1 Tax=Pityogenes trepanatus TaxID=445567 RepID=A0A343A5J9_9CUCU|nr:ATP synthase F0 subunit 8 [Pityogenes trepanatus]
MPQMAPMSWLTLFILFTMLFLLTIILNFFFLKNNSINNKTLFKNKAYLNKYWKW